MLTFTPTAVLLLGLTGPLRILLGALSTYPSHRDFLLRLGGIKQLVLVLLQGMLSAGGHLKSRRVLVSRTQLLFDFLDQLLFLG